MDALIPAGRFLMVKQIKEGVEIALGWNTRNRYQLQTENGEPLGQALEESKGLAPLLRNVLGSARACRIAFVDRSGREVGSAEKPFRLYFHHFAVRADGQLLGTVDRKWSWLTAHLEVRGPSGEPWATIRGRGLRIWTYHVTEPSTGREIATIQKKWGGALKEMFTNADTFGIQFIEPSLSPAVKKLLLASALLLDLVAFEQR
jgi:hypothetical protein